MNILQDKCSPLILTITQDRVEWFKGYVKIQTSVFGAYDQASTWPMDFPVKKDFACIEGIAGTGWP